MGMGMQTYIVGSETYPVGISACRPTQWGSGHADYTVGMGTQTYPMEPWDLPIGEGRVNLLRGVKGGGGGGGLGVQTYPVCFLSSYSLSQPPSLCNVVYGYVHSIRHLLDLIMMISF